MYKRLAVAGLLFGLAVNANAVPVTFDLAGGPGSYVDVSDVDCEPWCSVTAEINENLDLLSHTLLAGESWTFDFFTIHFPLFGGGAGTVEAHLAFDEPVGAETGVGQGAGWFASFLVTAGELVWNTQPGSFLLSDGTSYSIWFENLAGITGDSATVEATITLNDEPNVSVPEPGSLALFGLGLLGLGIAARRRRVKRG